MLASFLAGWGGAASAGLNAYLPLLIVALADRFTSTIELGRPYDIISSTWGIILLLLLLPVELIADKIPGFDHASDLIHSAIRPAAAAFLMMALTDQRGHISAVIAFLIGLLTGTAVHVFKARARPAITMSMGGIGNPFISMIEDVVVVIIVLVAIFVPLALTAVLPLSAYALYRAYARMKKGSARLRRLAGQSV